MTEFGHTSAAFKIFGHVCRMDNWHAGPFTIAVNGRTWRFEDSDRFGPAILTKHDEPVPSVPGGKSPFWPAWEVWKEQGRRVADDGITCVWNATDVARAEHEA